MKPGFVPVSSANDPLNISQPQLITANDISFLMPKRSTTVVRSPIGLTRESSTDDVLKKVRCQSLPFHVDR
jgi:hypothetical protein